MSRLPSEQAASASNEQPEAPAAEAAGHHRAVRSFVLRAGRLTVGQKRALEELWPRFGIEEDGSPLDLARCFGNDLPVVMEIGFGNGDATWQMAASEPHHNFLGVEVHKPGVGHLLLKVEEHDLQNVRIACEDAVALLQDRIAADSLAAVRIYFPDPWPKKRHNKRRIVQPAFVQLLRERLVPGGLLHLATDWAPYAEWMNEVMQQSEGFENQSEGGPWVEKPAWRPDTKYEQRGERLGHEVFDLLWKRVD